MKLQSEVQSYRQVCWQALSAVIAAVFALILVLLIHPMGDGGWFWYSILFRRGLRIYSDLHLPLQPMLVLEMSNFQRLLGQSWIASLGIGIFNAILYLAGIFLVLRNLHWPDWQKAILAFCVFVTTTDFITFRFDDYHVLSCCFVVYSIALIEKIRLAEDKRTVLLYAAGLGALSGMCITNRLNDGAILLVSVIFVVFFLQKHYKLLVSTMIGFVAAIVAAGMILATGDSLGNWRYYTIVQAAKIKGGTGHVLLYPIQLPHNTARLLVRNTDVRFLGLYILAITLLWAYAVRRAQRSDGSLDKRWILGGIALLSPYTIFIVSRRAGTAAESVVYLAVLASFVLTFWALYRLSVRLIKTRKPHASDLSGLLLTIPFGQLCSISMSSGRWYPNAFPPTAAFVLTLPLAIPGLIRKSWHRAIFLMLVVVLGYGSTRDKMHTPFHWWDYHSAPLKEAHQWYQHPVYGRMYIETAQLNRILPVCEQIEAGKATGSDLLSLPYPYANYFCNIAPWHNYVQTFFDTSSKETIDQMMSELDANPPKWIFYQRQMRAVRQHEESFHEGKPLPHRFLDEMIVKRVLSGAWKVTYQFHPEKDGSTWYLIQTHP